MIQRTALHGEHLALKGRMVDFAGWELPVMYSSIIEEHNATRTKAGLFDVSHMGEVIVKGTGAESFLRRLIPTRLSKLAPGTSMYSCLCRDNGGVVDDIFIFMVSETEYYIVVNAATLDGDLDWMRTHATGDTEIIDVSAETSKIDLQGPASGDILKKVVGDERAGSMGRFQFFHTDYKGVRMMVSRTGYTGENGYELFVPNDLAVPLWRDILGAGEAYGIRPVGLGARDTLRLEAAYSLYGHELSDTITPVEAGLGWLVTSADDYIGRGVLAGQKENGAPRALICFELEGRGVPREHCKVIKDGVGIGISTSGGFSPTFKKGIGMALVRAGSLGIGDWFSLVVRDNPVPARVVKRPFYAFNG
ncbi:MAG TPA: glycine cleavage system aminomethyltransferase GcvT [Spirochaetota bacterium]|nr:glycine cleavage system aminomethyltransferase GcvT [Spirochaetota bacterium]